MKWRDFRVLGFERSHSSTISDAYGGLRQRILLLSEIATGQ
ncbi:hypothetical protein [Nostoc sp. NMS4]|nr:hypothetical protein [Nostoc sp. NMS4]